MAKLQFRKVLQLPVSPSPNIIYFVSAAGSDKFEIYVTDDQGQASRYLDTGANYSSAITTLEQKQTELAALLVSARKESAAVNITTSTVIDEISTKQTEGVKWMLIIKGNGVNANRRMMIEVVAMHDGTATEDATILDFTTYATLRLNEISDATINVILSGTGQDQRMQLVVTSPSIPVDVYAVRERLPGIDLNTGVGGSDGNHLTPSDLYFLFNTSEFTINPNMVL